MLEATRGVGDVVARSFRTLANTNVAFYRGPTLDLQADQSVTIDFAQGQAPQPEALTLPVLEPSENLDVTIQLVTPRHRVFTLGAFHYPASALPSNYDTPAVRHPGDLVLLSVSATTSGGDRAREMAIYATTPAAVAVALPASWSSPAPSEPQVLDMPFRRPSVTFPIVPLSLRVATYEVRCTTESVIHDVMRSWEISVSQQWAADPTEVSVTAPDLSHLTEWRSEMGLLPGVPVSWTLRHTERDSLYGAGATDSARVLSNTAGGELTGPKACVAGAARTIDLTACAESQKASAWMGQSTLHGKLELAGYTTHQNWVCQTSIPQAWPIVPEPLWWCGSVYNPCTCSPSDGCH